MYQLIPFDRLRQFFLDVFRQSISPGTLVRMLATAAHDLQPLEDSIRRKLQEEPVINCDETGIRIENNAWLHVVSTDRLTLFQVHRQRGKKALDALNVLPSYRGVALHDCYSSYFRYTDCTHALCNSHILRELKAAAELTEQAWPQELSDLFLDAHRQVEAARAQGKSQLPEDKREEIHKRYADLLQQGLSLHPVPAESSPARRGRPKKTKVRNLLERLAKYEDAILLFIDDFHVPFTNNQAEQDLRVAKVKQKVSGGFRTDIGAECFYRIRGYVSTACKCGLTDINSLRLLFEGRPFAPARGP